MLLYLSLLKLADEREAGMQIPGQFAKKTDPSPLKFDMTGELLKRFMDTALTQGNSAAATIINWMEQVGEGHETFTAYYVGNWAFLAVDGTGRPWKWRDTRSSLGWNVFQNTDEESTMTLEEAIEHFNVFFDDLMRNIGLVN